MMTELSLNVLDVANNSVSARASLIEITVRIQESTDLLTIIICDNGCGMTKEKLSKVDDPFYTTRTTRNVGLGIPFFKQSALSTGGNFIIESAPEVGTKVVATFRLTHIDRMPLGDINSTIYTLITQNLDIDFLYTYELNDKLFQLDTREFRKILGNIPMNAPEVSDYIKEYLEENQHEVDGGLLF